MAKLLPSVNINDIEVKSERDVAKALVEKLPNDCVVFHSFPWLNLERHSANSMNSYLQEGEADFLIIWPEYGLLVLEVKGGKIRFEPDSMLWYSENRHGKEFEIKDPFKQASKNLHAIKKILTSKAFSGQSLPFAFGYAVCFPDLVYKGGKVPGSDPNIVIDLSDFLTNDSFANAVRIAMVKWNRLPKPVAMTKDVKLKLQQALAPEFKLIAKLSRQIDAEEEQLIRLTEEQYRVLEFCRSNHRVAIEGVAGSGKTLLALEQSRFFAESQKRVLFLCYNKALAKWLQQQLKGSEWEHSIVVRHFHGLVAEVCKLSHQEFNPASSKNFWVEDAANMLANGLSVLPDFRLDAVVVDEAQDFAAEWWLALDEITPNGSSDPLYVFYDPRQALFQPKETIPDMAFGGTLPTNCRNTKNISKVCGQIINEKISNHPMMPSGEPAQWFENASSKMRASLVEAELKLLITEQGLSSSQIAFLSPNKRSNTCMKSYTGFNKLPVSDNVDAWQKGQCILMTTIRAFKGLEADVVFLILDNEPKDNSLFTTADFYVACSRAKHLLKIFTNGHWEQTYG